MLLHVVLTVVRTASSIAGDHLLTLKYTTGEEKHRRIAIWC
jgi:hypothetical protein